MKYNIALLSLLVGVAGCALPSNTVSIVTPAGTWTMKTQKDNVFKGVDFEVVTTNGTKYVFKADSIVATNSPAAMDAQGASDVGRINAMSSLLNTVTAAAAKGATP